VAEATRERFVQKATRIAEQDAPGGARTGQRGGRDRLGNLSARLERVAGRKEPTPTAPGQGPQPLGGKAIAVAAAEPGAPPCGPESPANEQAPRLYEQAAPASPESLWELDGLAGRCGDYVRRWWRWVTSGLAGTRWVETRMLGGTAAPHGQRLTQQPPRTRA
jgi:hypothetical protein